MSSPTKSLPNVLTLIGMPGSGKSTIATILAERFDRPLIDVDTVIEQRHDGMPLGEILRELGREKFLDAEADAVESLTPTTAVIAPGGSVIYRPRCMAHLRRLGPVVYLQLTLDQLTPRLGDLAARGVAGNEGGLPALFAERTPLYEEHATQTVDASGTEPNVVAERVVAAVANPKSQ
ncbi:MAG: shikimate kinase [Planctomycetota bacterium]